MECAVTSLSCVTSCELRSPWVPNWGSGKDAIGAPVKVSVSEQGVRREEDEGRGHGLGLAQIEVKKRPTGILRASPQPRMVLFTDRANPHSRPSSRLPTCHGSACELLARPAPPPRCALSSCSILRSFDHIPLPPLRHLPESSLYLVPVLPFPLQLFSWPDSNKETLTNKSASLLII
jgi:hypothetical protein